MNEALAFPVPAVQSIYTKDTYRIDEGVEKYKTSNVEKGKFWTETRISCLQYVKPCVEIAADQRVRMKERHYIGGSLLNGCKRKYMTKEGSLLEQRVWYWYSLRRNETSEQLQVSR